MFGRKNGCRYFIDSENVNEVWVNILNILKPEDLIFLFYTDNSAHISCAKAVELINIGAKQIRGIRCKEGNNGLDFQMVTQLGAVISKSPKREYILISNDNGFDAVVSYWKQKGYNIRREKSSFCVALQISDPSKPSTSQKRSSNTNRRISGQKSSNRPRLENKKDYKKQPPKLEDKTRQPAGGKTNSGKTYENKTNDVRANENKTYESKAHNSKASGSKAFDGKATAGKAADGKAFDDKSFQDRASDNQKVVDLEAQKARKLEEKKRREKAREAEAEKKNRAAAVLNEETFARNAAEAEAVQKEAVLGEEAAWTENGMEAGAVRRRNRTEIETVEDKTAEIKEAVEAETAPEETAAEKESAREDAAPDRDDAFEPMEKPMAIPDTAMVADGTRMIDTRYCLQSLCTLISRKNMALFHNALTCIFEQRDGDEIYAAVKSHPELHTQLWSRYEQDREERIHRYLRLLLDVNDCEVQDTDLLYQVYRETYDGSLQGLNIGIMKAFGDETGVKYYRLLRKHINILTKF
ncbi:MAG: PIN domain-containing protein [Lachnospiraceae bacterium]|nr:PIN domain-containing protein [Lachnospiraceae bacterium]